MGLGRNAKHDGSDPTASIRKVLVTVWAAWMASFIWIAVAYGQRAMHPRGWFFLGMLVLQALGALTAWGMFAVCIWRRKQTLRMSGMCFVTATPALIWAALFTYGIWFVQGRDLDTPWLLKFLRPGGLGIMNVAAHLQFPDKLVGEKAVLFHDGSVHAAAELAAMETHIRRIERLLGREIREPVYWIRGSLLGIQNRGDGGWAFGSESTRTEQGEFEGLTSLDQHEAAHAVIEQFSTFGTDTPALLIEGWAETQSGYDPGRVVANTWRPGGDEPLYSLRELVSPEWYRKHEQPVYTHGGVLVEHLLCRYGAERFQDLYFTCRRDTFAADCERTLGVTLAKLEKDYWADVQRQLDLQDQLTHVELAEGVDEELWRQLVDNYKGRSDWLDLLRNRRLVCEYEKVTPPADDETAVPTLRYNLQADEQRFVLHKEGDVEQLIVATPQRSFHLHRPLGEAWTVQSRVGSKPHRDYSNMLDALASAAIHVVRHESVLSLRFVFSREAQPVLQKLEPVRQDNRDLVRLEYLHQRTELRGELFLDPAADWTLYTAARSWPDGNHQTESLRELTPEEPSSNGPLRTIQFTSTYHGEEHVEVTRVLRDEPLEVVPEEILRPETYGVRLPEPELIQRRRWPWWLKVVVGLPAMSLSIGIAIMAMCSWRGHGKTRPIK